LGGGTTAVLDFSASSRELSTLPEMIAVITNCGDWSKHPL
jgi:hypothetical protein